MKKTNRMIFLPVGIAIMLLAGTVYTWTIISKSISATFPSWNAQTLSMTFTVTMMFYALGGLASGVVYKRTGPKPVLLAGGILFAGGMTLASLAQAPLPLYIGYGAMCGFATGLCYNSVVSTVSAWFPDRQGVTSGTLLAAFGLSSFIAGKLFAALAPADGSRTWAAGLRIVAVLMLTAALTGAAVFRLPKPHELEAGGGQKKSRREPASDIPPSKMLRTASFWLFYIWVSLLTAAGLTLVGQASGIAGEVGTTLSGNTIATVVGMISIMNAAGRICTGTVYDRFGYRVTMWMIMGTFAFSAVMMILAILTGVFPLIVVGFIAGGFAYGGNASIIAPLISDFYGRTWYSTNFSIVPTNALFTSFAAVLAGRLYDRTQSFLSSLLLLFGAVVVAILLSFLIRRPGEGKKE